MKKEMKWITVLYIASLSILLFQNSFIIYEITQLKLSSGSGQVMFPFTVSTTFSLFIPVLLFARAAQVILARGLNYVPPQSMFVLIVRRLSLTFLAIGVTYYIVAYGVALVFPNGGYALMFKYLMPPVATMLLMFEFSRISSIESVQSAT